MPTTLNLPATPESFTQRILARPERSGRRPVEDDDAFGPGGIGVENRPAGDHRNAQSTEVGAADAAMTEAESAALPSGLTFRNDPATADVETVERSAVVHRKGGALDVRQLPEVPQR